MHSRPTTIDELHRERGQVHFPMSDHGNGDRSISPAAPGGCEEINPPPFFPRAAWSIGGVIGGGDREDREPVIGSWAVEIHVSSEAGASSDIPNCSVRLASVVLTCRDYFTFDADGLLSERPSIKTMFLAFSISRSCKILLTRAHSPSVK